MMSVVSSLHADQPYAGPVCVIGIGAAGKQFENDFWASRFEHPAFDNLYMTTKNHRRTTFETADVKRAFSKVSRQVIDNIAAQYRKKLQCSETIFIAISRDATVDQRTEAQVLGALANSSDLLCIMIELRDFSALTLNQCAFIDIFGAMDARWSLPAKYTGCDEQISFRWFFIAMMFLEVKGIEALYPLFDRFDISESLPTKASNLVAVTVSMLGENRVLRAVQQAFDDLFWTEAVNAQEISFIVVIIVARQRSLRYREVDQAMRAARRMVPTDVPVIYFTPQLLPESETDEVFLTVVVSPD